MCLQLSVTVCLQLCIALRSALMMCDVCASRVRGGSIFGNIVIGNRTIFRPNAIIGRTFFGPETSTIYRHLLFMGVACGGGGLL